MPGLAANASAPAATPNAASAAPLRHAVLLRPSARGVWAGDWAEAVPLAGICPIWSITKPSQLAAPRQFADAVADAPGERLDRQ